MATYTNVSGVLECVGTDITSIGIYNAIIADGTLGDAVATQLGSKHQFYFGVVLSIGNSGSTGLNSIWDCSSQEISINAGSFRVYGSVKMGDQADGYSANGGAFVVTMGADLFRLYTGGKCLVYGSYLYASGRIRLDGSNEWVTEDCDFEPEDGVSLNDGWVALDSTVSYKNTRVHHTGAVGIKLYGDASNTFNLDNVRVQKCTYAFQLDGVPKVVKNVKIDSCTNHTVPNKGNANITFINPDFLVLRQASSSSSDVASIEFEYNLVIKDSSGVNLDSVRVYLVDEQGSIRNNSLTDSSGKPLGLTTFQHSTWAGNTPTARAIHVVKYRKYGYLFGGGSRNAVANNNETSRLGVNSVTTLSEASAGALTGIAIDGSLKTITVSQSITSSDLYDYSQWWSVQSGNIQYDESLLSSDGVNFTLNTGWVLILENEISGGINITGDVKMSGGFNLTAHKLTGDLNINTGANSTLTFSNVSVSGNVWNDDTAHTLVIQATNGSSLTAGDPGTGIGQTNVQNTKSFSFSVNPSITGYEWRVYSVTAQGSLAGSVELAGEETATQDHQVYVYNYTADTPMALQIISQPNADYVESITYYILGNSNQTVIVNLSRDNNN